MFCMGKSSRLLPVFFRVWLEGNFVGSNVEEVGTFPSGGFVSRQKVGTDGAHAAALFSNVDGSSHFLAVANLGDRQANTYQRESVVYSFDPSADHSKMLKSS